ncbi:MAG TPA: hypothetical protein VK059_03725 [Nocardioidaceae bacterium]|nr:hypothetical protein [Nocardioidaceae bacterium]
MSVRRLAYYVIGLGVILPLLAIDPAIIAMLFDPEFLTITGTVGVAMVRNDVRTVVERLRSSGVVIDIAAGIAMAREDPRSLMRT